jgi:hypothetical protein
MSPQYIIAEWNLTTESHYYGCLSHNMQLLCETSPQHFITMAPITTVCRYWVQPHYSISVPLRPGKASQLPVTEAHLAAMADTQVTTRCLPAQGNAPVQSRRWSLRLSPSPLVNLPMSFHLSFASLTFHLVRPASPCVLLLRYWFERRSQTPSNVARTPLRSLLLLHLLATVLFPFINF